MPRLSKKRLLEKIVRAIHEGGWNVSYHSKDHPFRLRIYNRDEDYLVRIYIWNLTHGGGAKRPKDEYRIQITGIKGQRFIRISGELTLILGWWDEGQIFAGFDYNFHAGTLGNSPSIQIRKDALLRAAEYGFAVHRKGNLNP